MPLAHWGTPRFVNMAWAHNSPLQHGSAVKPEAIWQAHSPAPKRLSYCLHKWELCRSQTGNRRTAWSTVYFRVARESQDWALSPGMPSISYQLHVCKTPRGVHYGKFFGKTIKWPPNFKFCLWDSLKIGACLCRERDKTSVWFWAVSALFEYLKRISIWFLLACEGYSYERVDGSVRGEERYLAIKNFGQQPIFVFLLSTRAGKSHWHWQRHVRDDAGLLHLSTWYVLPYFSECVGQYWGVWKMGLLGRCHKFIKVLAFWHGFCCSQPFLAVISSEKKDWNLGSLGSDSNLL